MSNTKKYDGKIFKRHGYGVVSTRREAEEIADNLRKKGYNARIQYYSRQKGYIVFKRKKGKKK